MVTRPAGSPLPSPRSGGGRRRQAFGQARGVGGAQLLEDHQGLTPGRLGGRPVVGGRAGVAQAGEGEGLVAWPVELPPEGERPTKVVQGLAEATVGQLQVAKGAEGERLAIGIVQLPDVGQGPVEEGSRLGPVVTAALDLAEGLHGQGFAERVAQLAFQRQGAFQLGGGLLQPALGPVELAQLAMQLRQAEPVAARLQHRPGHVR
jgi:hypothetical protein